MTGDSTPSTWSGDARERFRWADEIEISTRRPDGSLRSFLPIWIVAVGDDLYVRSYRGAAGSWYRHATRHPIGAIRVGGRQADVTFTQVDTQQHNVLDAIGDAYRAKYARYGDTYLQPMFAEHAVTTTLRLIPQT